VCLSNSVEVLICVFGTCFLASLELLHIKIEEEN
jgi:hypothetical protein